MATVRWGDMTWEEIRDRPARAAGGPVAILPVGAIEAHGPQLPLSTDIIIAEAMAEAAAAGLSARGIDALVLPALYYGAAPFGAAFPGTIPVGPAGVATLIQDIGRALLAQGVGTLAIANAHLDPAHLDCLHGAVAGLKAEAGVRAVFPDLTRKPWALRLGEEFKSGACHAGRFETSIVMAARPDLVRENARRALPEVPVSLSRAIREGKRDFASAGGPRAYFGAPAEASVAEGRETIAVLGAILEEAVMAELGP